MSADQVAASKSQIHSQLKEASIRLFSFSLPASADTDNQGVYAISSAAGPDHDTMDASLLMSPDYVQPLSPTELSTLVSEVFTPAGIARLRHAVARKYVQWRNHDSRNHTPSLFSNLSHPPHLTNPFTPTTPRSGSRTSNSILTPPGTGPNPIPNPNFNPNPNPSMNTRMATPPSPGSYALARLAEHTQREERLAQVRLANWAADLQRSLAREREQYAALARAERAVWLAERVGEVAREVGVDDERVGGLGGEVVVAERGRRRRSRGQGGTGGQGGRDVVGGRRYVGGGRAGGGGGGGDGDDGFAERLGEFGGRGYDSEAAKYLRQGRAQNQYQGQGEGHAQSQKKHRQDPLGLLEVADELRRRGLVALEVLGSIGVLGGLALWVTRHYLHGQTSPAGWLPGDWERFWYGLR